MPETERRYIVIAARPTIEPVDRPLIDAPILEWEIVTPRPLERAAAYARAASIAPIYKPVVVEIPTEPNVGTHAFLAHDDDGSTAQRLTCVADRATEGRHV